MAAASTISATLRPVDAWIPAFAARARPASTTSARPTVSYPTWVIQLKADTSRAPLGPNGARVMANTDVPACGPWRLPIPVTR